MIDRNARSHFPAPCFEPLEGRAMMAGDLAVSSVTSTVMFATQLQERAVVATTTMENVGDQSVNGTVKVEFFLSADDTIGSTDFQLASKDIRRAIAPGGTAKVSIKVPIPHDLVGALSNSTLPAGDYRLLTRLSVSNGAVDSNAANNTGAAPGSVPVSYEFGDIGLKKTLALKTFLSAFQFVTLRLWGGGRGELVSNGGTLSLRLTGTTSQSRLSIETPNSFLSASLSGIDVDGPIGSISGVRADITGNISIAGSVRTIDLRDISSSAWSIGGSDGQSQIRIRNATNVSLSSSQPISLLSATSWTTFDGGDDAIVAPRIGEIKVKGAMDPDVSISGTGQVQSLAKANIIGAASGRWDITGEVGSIRVGSAGSGFAANIAGDIGTFTVAGAMTGSLAAANIGTFIVSGALTNSAILAGANLGSDAALGGTGTAADQFATGRIGSIRIGGVMTNSLLAAGLDPVDNSLLTDDDRFVDTRSSLGTIVVLGNVTGSSFAAPLIPGYANLNGRSVKTSADARFVTSLA